MELNDILKELSIFGNDRPIPREALAEAARQKEAITPYLLDALDRLYEGVQSAGDGICDDTAYDLSCYAFFLLAQFREQRAFPRVLRMLTLDNDALEIVFGDMITLVGNILYSTYDGDLSSAEAVILNESADPFAREAPLRLLEGLFRDGRLPRETMISFLRERLEALGEGEDEQTFGAMLADAIAECDLYELAEDVREVYRQGKADPMHLGDFDGFFDYLYNETRSEDYPKMIDDTASELRGWACFQDDTSKEPSIREILTWNVGRNDPCPCGSGKKFKKCCLPKKEKWELEMSRPWEPDWDRYPALVRQGVRPGLLEFYTQEAIDVDRPVYQALNMIRHPAFRHGKERRKIEREAKNLLLGAYGKLREMCSERGLKTPEDYDRMYRVHYDCTEWLTVLRDFLAADGDAQFKEVDSFISPNRAL